MGLMDFLTVERDSCFRPVKHEAAYRRGKVDRFGMAYSDEYRSRFALRLVGDVDTTMVTAINGMSLRDVEVLGLTKAGDEIEMWIVPEKEKGYFHCLRLVNLSLGERAVFVSMEGEMRRPEYKRPIDDPFAAHS